MKHNAGYAFVVVGLMAMIFAVLQVSQKRHDEYCKLLTWVRIDAHQIALRELDGRIAATVVCGVNEIDCQVRVDAGYVDTYYAQVSAMQAVNGKMNCVIDPSIMQEVRK